MAVLVNPRFLLPAFIVVNRVHRGYYYDLQNVDQSPPEVQSISVPNGTETLATWLVEAVDGS